MSAYLKNTLLVKSMVTNGNEGYRARGTYDPYASISYPVLNWWVEREGFGHLHAASSCHAVGPVQSQPNMRAARHRR